VLGYYRCPMLCNLTRNGLVDAMKELDWSAGREFAVLFVSINPDETPEDAAVKKDAYLLMYARDDARAGLHFLTGRQRDIELLARATGFGYRFDPLSGDYAHTSTIMFVTPDGRLSRYINDVVFQPRNVKLALIEASEGAIGSPMDKFLLFMCYHYDPLRGSYAASAWKLMRLGAAATAMLLALGLGFMWWRGSDLEKAKRLAQGVT
jgi:protein SCO1/2